ncbi:MAG: DUF3987 domain-containing protein, partial [Nitrospirae bacterium]|nr:DUF3987 domain-containing protein [Nitrospirota bacterium]
MDRTISTHDLVSKIQGVFDFKRYAENDFRLNGTNPVCGCESKRSGNGNTPATSINPITGVGKCNKCLKGFNAFQFADAAGLLEKQTKKTPAEIYNLSTFNLHLIRKYLATRKLSDISDEHLKASGLRINEYDGKTMIVYPISDKAGNIVQIQRIFFDHATGKKIEKKQSGHANRVDRAFILNPDRESCVIFEGLEDGLSWLQYTGWQDTVVIASSTAGFACLSSILTAYIKPVLILDPDAENQSMIASISLGEIVIRKIPTTGQDCNAALQDGTIAQWFNGLRHVPLSEAEEAAGRKGAVIELYDNETDIEEDEGEDDGSLDFDKQLLPLEPFPFEVFPAWCNDFIGILSTSLSVDRELVASLSLPIVGAAIGNTTVLQAKPGWQVPPFIWLNVVAPTGTGKSPAMNIMLSRVQQLQKKVHEEYKEKLKIYNEWMRTHKNGKKDEDDPKPDEPNLKQFVISDTTIEALVSTFAHDPRGVLMHQDEIGGWIKAMNQYKGGKGNDKEQYLSLWNSAPIKVDRKSGIAYASKSGASFIGGIQPSILPLIFSDDSFDNGLFSRFLFYCTFPKKLKFSRVGITVITMLTMISLTHPRRR